jgi:Ca-activated chloride channel family protein
MNRRRFGLFFVLLAAFAGTSLLLPRHERRADAAAAVATGASAGALQILDKTGKPIADCPLKHTDVQADIAGYVARVTVTQQFHNASASPVEAIYTFPLPDDAAVDDMTMTIGHRVVRGEIKRREEARQIYEAAKSAGQAAALLDQERPNVFTQTVANIMPGQDVKVVISYVHLVKYDDGRYEFSFPMVVGPRYTPGGGYDMPGVRGGSSSKVAPVTPPTNAVVTDADKITPPITPEGTRSGHDISLTVRLEAALPLTDVTSVLHPVTIDRVGVSKAVIRLKDQASIPNKDFILRYTAAGSEVQSGLMTYAPVSNPDGTPNTAGAGYFTLVLQPPAAAPRNTISPKEMVFVIDQTGSQQGWPIAKAKETMRHCIQNLNPGDTFQLLGFNTQVYPCFNAPVQATPENVAKALKYLQPLEGAGGTDLLKAADYALKIPADPNRLRIICFMTDGYVGDDMQILDFIKKHRGEARMFPFGVGDGVNRFLIDGMAREGRGSAEYVTLNDDGHAAAARFYKRVADPVLLNVAVDWNGLPVADVYPKHIPDVFSSGPVIVKGRYTHSGEGDIVVSGLLHGEPWTRRVHVVFPKADKDGSAMANLWARDRIEDLQSDDWYGAQAGKPDPKIKEAIVDTALQYQLMSQWTSFVAVEQTVVNIGGQQQTIDVPVEMPEGVSYDGIFGGASVRGAMGSVSLMNGAPVAATGMGGIGGGAGFGGGFAGAARRTMKVADKAEPSDALSEDRDIAEGTDDGKKRLEALKPDERRKLLEQVKLADPLRSLLEEKRKNAAVETVDGITLTKDGRLLVQIWLNTEPEDLKEQLTAAGFQSDVTLKPGKLILGRIAPDKLDALIALGFVRYVEQPKKAK